MPKTKIPNPGSDEALERGCTCAVVDNHYGKGFLFGEGDEPCFWVTEGCPLHSVKKGSGMLLIGKKERENS